MSISSANFSLSENEIAKVIWRKAFSGPDEFEKRAGAFATAEYKYLLREILNLCARRGILVFNRPDAEQQAGKVVQLRLAARHFATPGFRLISKETPTQAGPECVAKSLASVPFDNGNVLYTTDISNELLADRNLWFIQKTIKAQFDVTVAYIYGRIFSYKLSRDKFTGLDWRKNPFELGDQWEPHNLSPQDIQSVHQLMHQLGWPFGRLDFLLSDGLLYFLEVNPNGQWAWLDPAKANGLFAAIRECIDPTAPIPIVQHL